MPDTSFPPSSFYFNLKVEGIPREMSFEGVGGLAVEIQTEEVTEGGINKFARQLPHAVKFNNLILKRGLVADPALMGWIQKAIQNFTFSTKKVELRLLDNNGNILVNWTFQNAYPVAAKISELDSRENKIVLESLELAYDRFTRTDIPI